MAQSPQNSLLGARATTSTPQTMKAPAQLNANAMNNQVQGMQNQSVPTAQAVNAAASNPNNRYYAKGGSVTPPAPPSKSDIDTKLTSTALNQADLATLTKALQGEVALKDQKGTTAAQSTPATVQDQQTPPRPEHKPPVPAAQQSKDQQMMDMFNGYTSPEGQQEILNAAKDRQHVGYAKGGDVHSQIKDMSLKDIVKLLASHPDVAKQSGLDSTAPMKSTDMRTGGSVTANTQGKSEARSHGKGLLAMNDDVGGYAQGGIVDADGDGDSEVQDNTAGMSDGKSPPGMTGDGGVLKMASGGSTMEADNITGYGPDGTPILKDQSGSQQYGSINDLLGRPKNTSTLAMAKGGEEAPPPGSLSKEVADDVPAKLSEGEFVFSADVVRYYGLKLLNEMMEHGRNALAEMNSEGDIRHPGDGKNPDEAGGKFMQDHKPNMEAYDDEDQDDGHEDEEGEDKVIGLLKECTGGGVKMAEGGGLGEEQSLAKGGSVYGKDEYPVGRDHMVSAHPKGGSVAMDYARGGIVSPTATSMFPKKNESIIPSGQAKIPGVKKSFGSATSALPKMAEGGLLGYNGAINSDTHQSYVGH